MRLVNYVKNSYDELVHKVTWPTFSELQNSAIVVLVASLIFALIIWGMNYFFEWLMQTIYTLLY